MSTQSGWRCGPPRHRCSLKPSLYAEGTQLVREETRESHVKHWSEPANVVAEDFLAEERLLWDRAQSGQRAGPTSAISGRSSRRVPIVPAVGGDVKLAAECSLKPRRDRDVPRMSIGERLASTLKAHAGESPRVKALRECQAPRWTEGRGACRAAGAGGW